jgi:hypothetical protein
MKPELIQEIRAHARSLGTREFTQGVLIDERNSEIRKAHLVLVCSGSVEIFEHISNFGYNAYRPVAVIEQGELFQLFDFMDHFCRTRRAGPEKEIWKICSGPASCLVLTEYNGDQAADRIEGLSPVGAPPPNFPKGEDKVAIVEPRLVLNALLRAQKVKLEFFEFPDVDKIRSERPDLLLDLATHAWSSFQEYRQGRNIYNQDFYDRIREDVLISRAVRNQLHLSKHVPEKESLASAVIYAAIEALERPLHDSPMFFRPAGPVLERKPGMRGDDPDYLDLSTVLHASRPSSLRSVRGDDMEMLFPVGAANVTVNRFLKSRYKQAQLPQVERLIARMGREEEGWRALKVILDATIREFGSRWGGLEVDYPFIATPVFEQKGERDRVVPLLSIRPKAH